MPTFKKLSIQVILTKENERPNEKIKELPQKTVCLQTL